MKRIISVLAVMGLMAAMLAVMAMLAFAEGKSEGAPNCEDGNNAAYGNYGSDQRSNQGNYMVDKNYLGYSYWGGQEKNPNAAYCLR